MVTKSQLTERKRGKGGTLVVWNGGIYVVKDKMERKGYDIPNRIGIGPVDRGVAFGVKLDEVRLAGSDDLRRAEIIENWARG